MYVCICKAVNKQKLKEVTEKGDHNLPSVMKTCGAGSDCGSCIKKIREVIKEFSTSEKHKKAD